MSKIIEVRPCPTPQIVSEILLIKDVLYELIQSPSFEMSDKKDSDKAVVIRLERPTQCPLIKAA